MARLVSNQPSPFSNQTVRPLISESCGRPKLSVVIPVFNERSTIEELLDRVQRVQIDKEVIIVDDGSTDGTREFLSGLAKSHGRDSAFDEMCWTDDRTHREPIRMFFLNKNRGKGAALRLGFKEARGEIVLVQDADLEYDPIEYDKLLDPIERGLADVVYGTRFGGAPQRVWLFWPFVGNKILTMLSNVSTNLNLSDVWTGYKVFRREVLDRMTLRENRFGFEPEVTTKVAKGNWRVCEVPISYWARSYSEGKKITWRDGIKGLYCTLWYRFFD